MAFRGVPSPGPGAYARGMPDGNRLGEFLRARRALVGPDEVGLPAGGHRRVPGLRREELALLAGVSPSYYVRLEQGRDRHPSAEILDAIADVLRLDEATTAHLHELARSAPRRRRGQPRPERVRPELKRLLDAHVNAPAFILGRWLDVLAANDLARALHAGFTPGRNLVHDVFLDAATSSFFMELDDARANTVGSLRAAAGADADDARLTELVGELSIKSREFRSLWARHEIRPKAGGTKRVRHPVVGELTLDYETFIVGDSRAQQLVVYHAAPGSDAQRALTFAAQTMTLVGDGA